MESDNAGSEIQIQSKWNARRNIWLRDGEYHHTVQETLEMKPKKLSEGRYRDIMEKRSCDNVKNIKGKQDNI